MNERAIQWAWDQMLPSTHKLILLALADLADDAGVSSPRVAALAARCAVSTRTVRRVLRDLEADDLLSAEAQIRADGSTTSNRYSLKIPRGHTLSAPSDIHVTDPGQTISRAAVTYDPQISPCLFQAGYDQRSSGQANTSAQMHGAATRTASSEILATNSVRPVSMESLLPYAESAAPLSREANRPQAPGIDGPSEHGSPRTSPPDVGSASLPTPSSGPPPAGNDKPFAYLRSVIGG